MIHVSLLGCKQTNPHSQTDNSVITGVGWKNAREIKKLQWLHKPLHVIAFSSYLYSVLWARYLPCP